ncbi:MAG: NADH-quinone oxidoreductase subunit J [candidate division NC10 bacterium]|nr:NADH-quinone oxidoreductase subunit J [candidate division NC10 bacterium]
MSIELPVFYFLAAITIGAALIVVLGRNIVHCAFSLVLAFFGVAGLYVLLDAEFLAAVQVLIYVGGITILLLFAIMLTSRASGPGVRILNEQLGLSALIAGGLFFLLIYALWKGIPALAIKVPTQANVPTIGRVLMTSYVLPFEVASVLLLAALVGALILARKEKD